MGTVYQFRRPLERTIERWFRGKAEEAGYAVLKLSTPGRKGYPDRIVLARGPGTRSTAMFVEFKRPGGVLTKLQEIRHEELVQRGYQVVVVSTKDEAVSLLTLLGVEAK